MFCVNVARALPRNLVGISIGGVIALSRAKMAGTSRVSA
jgi:hypothetical protein